MAPSGPEKPIPAPTRVLRSSVISVFARAVGSSACGFWDGAASGAAGSPAGAGSGATTLHLLPECRRRRFLGLLAARTNRLSQAAQDEKPDDSLHWIPRTIV